MTTYTARVTCPDGHITELPLINPRQREDGTIGGYLSSSADYCDCGQTINTDPVILGDGIPVNDGPQKIGVWLSSEELGLLRAGLAAHAIALSGNPPRPTPKETETITEMLKGNFHRHEVAKKQREACRELSIRLGDAQIQVNG